MNSQPKQLFRSKANRKIAGVCGGLGTYLNVDPTIMRLLFIVLMVISFGVGFLGYIAMWVIVPEEPEYQRHGCTVDHDQSSPDDHKDK